MNTTLIHIIIKVQVASEAGKLVQSAIDFANRLFSPLPVLYSYARISALSRKC